MATRVIIVTFLAALLVFCCLCLIGLAGYFTYVAASDPIVQTSVVGARDTATPTPAPVVMRTPLPPESAAGLQDLLAAVAPRRDLHDLARRMRGVENAPIVVSDTPANHQLGDEIDFNVSNVDTDENFTITAELLYETPHVYAFVETGRRVNQAELERLVDTFEQEIYPTNREFFGSEWTPGVDGDEHLYMLFAGNLGFSVAGYYSGADQVSRLVHEHSNEKEMFYINIDNVHLADDFTYGVLAHEFQHMIHWYNDANEDSWLNEGASELAAFLNGYDPGGFDRAFLANPDLQLTTWAEGPGAAGPNYGAGFLFMAYFLDRFGDDATQALVAHQENGMQSVDVVLAELDVRDPLNGAPITAGDVFADWTVANFLGDDAVADGRYHYSNYRSAPRASPTERIADCPTGPQARTVTQFGTDYIRLSCPGTHTLAFEGSLRVGLVPTEPREGRYMFWSNRIDDSDTTLTRAFDFSGVSSPITLDFWTWYEIEADFDYAYVAVSIDGGDRWTTLVTPSGTDSNPNGNNYGWAYHDNSGGGPRGRWINEQVDLSDYAGQEILLRFEYVTDDALTRPGFMLDDVRIDAIGYREGFEAGDGGWDAQGWVRVDNILPQTFLVQLIEFGPEVTVRRVELGDAQSAAVDVTLGSGVESVVLVVSGSTPITTEPASYQFEAR